MFLFHLHSYYKKDYFSCLILKSYRFIMLRKHFVCSINFSTARLDGCCRFQAIKDEVVKSGDKGR